MQAMPGTQPAEDAPVILSTRRPATRRIRASAGTSRTMMTSGVIPDDLRARD